VPSTGLVAPETAVQTAANAIAPATANALQAVQSTTIQRSSSMTLRRLSLCALLLLPSMTVAEDGVVYRAAHVLPVVGEPIDKGFVAVKGGKIVAVGRSADFKPLDGKWKEVDVGDATIIPGLVDTHSHIGVYSRPGVPANADGNEMSGPVQPGVRALDAF